MKPAKRTITLSKEVKEQAKDIAKSKRIGLSEYIHKVLEKSIENESQMDEINGNIPAGIRRLRGILKVPDISKEQLIDIKYECLQEKYNL